jgi:hypothetical protein
MDKYTTNIWLQFTEKIICEINSSIILYKDGKIKNCKNIAFDYKCELLNYIDRYVLYIKDRNKAQSYFNIIKFFITYYPNIIINIDIDIIKQTDHPSKLRSKYIKIFNKFIKMYLYEPCDRAIHSYLHKQATVVNNDRERKRERKRIKLCKN